MKQTLLALTLLTIACRHEAATAPPTRTAQTPRHYEIRADQLPAPFHTESVGNPPRLVARPSEAFLELPPGFRIEVFADRLRHPRNMIVAPNGDVIVAEQSADRIIILRDRKVHVFTEDVDTPYGLALRSGHLYVGTVGAVVRFHYKPGQLTTSEKPERIHSLPAGGHVTRNVTFNREGTKLYVAVGSSSNVSDESAKPMRAAISEMNPDGSGSRIFASGLRNPVGVAWNPATGELWTAVNERDGLGDDLVPDYITNVRDGAFYGWPYSYLGRNLDPRRQGEHPELVAKAIVPAVLLQAHSASLGLTFYQGTMFPARYRGGVFVALHGSWNRSNRTGYKIIHVPFRDGKPTGGYDDFITGWAPDPKARGVWGRPAAVLELRDGSLLIADDEGGVIWRVTYKR